MRKILLLFTLLLLPSIRAMADDMAEALQLQLNNGKTIVFLLDEMPEVTFSENKLIVQTEKTYAEYPLVDIARFDFQSVPTGVNALKDKEIRVTDNGNDEWEIKGDVTTAISVYCLSGKIARAKIYSSGNSHVVSLQSLPSGVYIISFAGQKLKVIKK